MTICQAIDGRRVIEFDYDGYPRVVHPVAHGNHVDTGNESFRGYQVGGGSSSGKVPAWKMFTTANVMGLVVTDDVFADDPPGYQPGDSHLVVHCEL